MRSDMNKVVCERPRYGERIKQPKGYYKELAHIPPEDHPKRESIRRKWIRGGNGKQFSDLLGPLRGYVLSVVGQRFDDVYSDIKKNMPGNNMSTKHILGHLWDFLERQVYLNEKGQPCFANREYWPRSFKGERLIEYRKHGPVAYVDPNDGIIKRAPEYVVPRLNLKVVNYRWRNDHLYERLDGIWYEITYAKYTVSRLRDEVMFRKYGWLLSHEYLVGGYDVALKEDVRELSRYELGRQHGRGGIYAAAKKQLNKRELKRLGLRAK